MRVEAIEQTDPTRGLGTRERILLESSRLFARRGYHQTSTREIAMRVGIQQPSLFYHFPNKAAIMDELLSLNYSRAVRFAPRILGAQASAAARLYCMLRTDLEYVVSLPYDLSGTFGEDILNDPEFRRWTTKDETLHDAWRELVRQGVEEGSFLPHDPVIIECIVIGALRELIRTATKHANSVAAAGDAARFVLRAMLADTARLESIVEEAEQIQTTTLGE